MVAVVHFGSVSVDVHAKVMEEVVDELLVEYVAIVCHCLIHPNRRHLFLDFDIVVVSLKMVVEWEVVLVALEYSGKNGNLN